MSEEILVKHCSPTLAGIKTGNLFNCEYNSEKELNAFIRDINGRLTEKGVRIIPLKYGRKSALIYAYRPQRLKKDLKNGEAAKILKGLGYGTENPDGCVASLAKRVKSGKNFPHEIGLFLSYPPEDVKGFMEQGAKSCKCSGCWKVYGDEKESVKTFCKFKKCTELYIKCFKCGARIEKLAVNDIN